MVSHDSFVRIQIRRVPPSEHLEGIDLRHYGFREGQTYQVGRRLGELLIAWGYAEEVRRGQLDRAADKP
jgi:hypothetical protein